jgi:methionyl-tRNA synthetase
MVSIDEFKKVVLAVGTIITCCDKPDAQKLYILTVDFGPSGKRTILSGIKQYYSPEDLIGKQAVFVLNLQPRVMMGIESQGMILTAATADGKPALVNPAALVPNGTHLK